MAVMKVDVVNRSFVGLGYLEVCMIRLEKAGRAACIAALFENYSQECII